MPRDPVAIIGVLARKHPQQSDLLFGIQSTDAMRNAKAKAASGSISAPRDSNHSTPAREQDTENSLVLVRQNHAPSPTFLNSCYSMAPTIDERASGFCISMRNDRALLLRVLLRVLVTLIHEIHNLTTIAHFRNL